MEILVKQDFESPAHGRMSKGMVREVEDADGRAFIRAGLAQHHFSSPTPVQAQTRVSESDAGLAEERRLVKAVPKSKEV